MLGKNSIDNQSFNKKIFFQQSHFWNFLQIQESFRSPDVEYPGITAEELTPRFKRLL